MGLGIACIMSFMFLSLFSIKDENLLLSMFMRVSGIQMEKVNYVNSRILNNGSLDLLH